MTSEAVPDLSYYEIQRARNIERNNARLRALGLISAREESSSNDTAWRKESIETIGRKIVNTSSTKRKRNTKANDEPMAGSRKSLRLEGKEPERIVEENPMDGSKENTETSLLEERQARVNECREVRLRRAVEVSQAGWEKAARENPTASYGHCLMRIRTMTENGLANRIKSIERAAGKHCVVKMAIFKSCLQDEGRWDLVDLAEAALERLKALKPVIDEESYALTLLFMAGFHFISSSSFLLVPYRRPVVSSRPKAMFKFWTAAPLAPYPRLSSRAHNTTC